MAKLYLLIAYSYQACTMGTLLFQMGTFLLVRTQQKKKHLSSKYFSESITPGLGPFHLKVCWGERGGEEWKIIRNLTTPPPPPPPPARNHM